MLRTWPRRRDIGLCPSGKFSGGLSSGRSVACLCKVSVCLCILFVVPVRSFSSEGFVMFRKPLPTMSIWLQTFSTRADFAGSFGATTPYAGFRYSVVTLHGGQR